MHFNVLKLSGALEEFSITSRFLSSKMQKSIFEENTRLIAFFFQIEAQEITNPSSRLEKHQNT